MNDLLVFHNEQFGETRWIKIDNKDYAVASDIASALGYKNTSKAIKDHCKGVTKRSTLTAGGEQELNYISESDIYRLIIRSKIPTAQAFETWIFDMVLPQIRQTGAYIPTVPEETDAELLSRAMVLATNTIALRDAKLKKAEMKVAEQARTLTVQAPKVKYFDNLAAIGSNTSITDTAKLFNIPRSVLIKFLLDEGFIFRASTKTKKIKPYMQYVGSLFALKEFSTVKYESTQMYITVEGKQVLRDLLIAKGVI